MGSQCILLCIILSIFFSCAPRKINGTRPKELTVKTIDSLGCFDNKNVCLIDLSEYAIPSGKINFTHEVQTAINTISSHGGKIIIPPYLKFNLTELVFPPNIEIEYYANSDISKDAGEVKATNEKIVFLANSNEQGIVNESIFAAPFHPGLILNVKKDVFGQKRLLGNGQSMDNPVRASFLIQDEGQTQFMEQYVSYPDFSNPYSGWRIGYIRNTYQLTGITSKDFKPALKVGDLIYAQNKMGSGHFIGEGNDYITVQWFSGRFDDNDELSTEKGVKSARKVSKATFNSIPFNSLSLSRKNGYLGIGIPNNNAVHPLTVGGKIGIQGSRQHGQFVPSENQEPAIVFSPSFEDKFIYGIQIKLDRKSDWQRILITDVEGSKNIAHVGAVNAHTSFDKLRLIPTNSSFNVKKIEKISLGTYKIIFEDFFSNDSYQVGLSTSKPLEFAYVDKKYKEYLIVKIVKTGTPDLIDPDGGVSVICIGGDVK
jgi:hypothetical protein